MARNAAAGREALDIELRIREEAQGETAVGKNGRAVSAAIRERAVHLLVLGAVLATSAVYVGLHIGSGWVPADEGTLAQSAVRVLSGQLPHSDFAEIYTGGLSVIHALAFRAFGINLMSLRICVFLFFLAWLPAIYYIALRFTSALGAGLITLLAVSWSFPNYPAAMPSWYNLFFASFGAAALLRYLEVRKTRWLLAAGVCGGISILIKVIGAYYIAGVLLFLVFVEQGDHESDETKERAIAYRVFSTSSLLLFLAVAIHLFHGRLGGGELYQFVLPAVALVGLILLSECQVRSAKGVTRFRALLRLVIPFVAGVLGPVSVFLVPYARSGTLGAFFSGVTGSAIARSAGLGVIRPAGMEASVYPLALIGLVAAAMYRREFQGKIVGVSVGVGLAALLYRSSQAIVSGVWFSAASLTPLVVLSGAAVVLTAAKSDGLTKLQRQRLMLLISLAALCSFVQFPFAAPIYLSYSLPLTLLAAVAIVATARKQTGTYVLAAVMGFYLLFGVVKLVPDAIYELTHKVGPMDELRVERAGGLRTEFAPSYDEIVHLLQQHSPNGLLYAGNDCPEFYFLAGLKNVTRDDGGAQPGDVLQALQANDVKVVVINERPFFPGSEMSPAVRAEIIRKFPESRLIGIFHIFWRE
ncbi:MAG: hypothetical protein WAU58_17100 [Terriglobales bacterium]